MKRRQIIMVAAAAIILGLFWFTYTAHREPRYKGRSLTEWLRLYKPYGLMTSKPSQEAADAVRHIGTNALPFLLSWAQEYQDMSPRRLRLFTAVEAWKPGTPGREVLMESIGRRQLRGERASWGFEILGETARGAVPDLARMITQGETRSASFAISVLPYLGRDGLHPLLSVLTNTTSFSWVKYEALVAVGRMQDLGTNAHAGVAALIRCLDDPQFAPSAASTLGMLRLESEISVPVLVECTRSTNFNLRMAAVTSLGEFGRDARSAVRDLIKLKDDRNASLRQAATNALERIADDALPP